MKNKSILKAAIIALFAAIICIGCFMRIPAGVVPIVLQNVLCILCAVLIGSYLGISALTSCSSSHSLEGTGKTTIVTTDTTYIYHDGVLKTK